MSWFIIFTIEIRIKVIKVITPIKSCKNSNDSLGEGKANGPTLLDVPHNEMIETKAKRKVVIGVSNLKADHSKHGMIK